MQLELFGFLSVMSCCCCCQRCAWIQWCAWIQCCPGLKHKSKGSPYPRIQYSPVASSNNADIADGPAHDEKRLKLLETHCVARPELVFGYLQGKSQFSVHPQIGVPTGTKPITKQPSAGSLMQRFSLDNAGASSEVPNHVSGLVGLPVYREKAVDTNDQGSDSKDPIIQFSLHYDVHQSKLRVHLQHASNLPEEFCRGMPAQCDPYVMLQLEPDREETFQSQIIKGTRNPTFNQDFQFKEFSFDNIIQQTLVCQIFNHASKKSLIGKACLPLTEVLGELTGVVMQMKIDTEVYT